MPSVFLGNVRGIKKDESRQLTWSVIYTNQATSLTRDIAVRSVIGLHKSDHVSDVICPLIDHGQQPIKMYIEVTLLYKEPLLYLV